MFTAQNTVNLTESEALLDSNPADYVEKISRYFESSTQQRHDAPDSDSGNSLFITQTPVPEATRSRKSLRLHRTSANYQEESDDDDSISAKQTKGRKCKTNRCHIHRLSKYHFPFLMGTSSVQLPLSRRKLTNITRQQNARLHYYSMGSFFKCVRGLQQSHKTGNNPEWSLPTVDRDGEEISPLSEEEEWSDNEDIRVVENHQFVVKPKRAHWNAAKMSNQEAKRQVRTDLQQKRWKNLKRTRTTPTSVVPGGRVWDRVSTAGVISHRSVMVQTEEASDWVKKYQRIVGDESKTQTAKTQQTINSTQSQKDQDLCNNNGATLSTADLQRCPEDDASSIMTEPEAAVYHKNSLSPTGHAKDKTLKSQNHFPDLISELRPLSDEAVVEKKKKGLSEDAGWSVDITEENRAVPPALQTDDELQFNENSWMKEPSSDSGNVLRQDEVSAGDGVARLKAKKKKHKNKSPGEDVRPEQEDNDLDPITRKEENSAGKKRKKKKKKREDVDVEQLLPSKDSEHLNDDATIITKKKKKKRKRSVEAVEDRDDVTQTLTLDPPQMLEGFEEAERCSQSTAVSHETAECGYVKRKRCKNKQQSSSKDDSLINKDGEDDCGRATQSVKKKKKKKRRVFPMIGEMDKSNTPEKVENTEESQKTTEDQNAETMSKTEKTRQISDKNTSEDTFTQSRKSESVREKVKKSIGSFRVDASSQSTLVTSGGEFVVPLVVTSQKASVALESIWRDHAVAFEQQNQTDESVFPKAKRKKKKRRDERGSECSGSVPDLEHSPTKEAVVLKKKMTKCKETPRDAALGLGKLSLSPCDGIQEKSAEKSFAGNVPNMSETNVAGEPGDATSSTVLRNPTLRHHLGKNPKIKPHATKNRKSCDVSNVALSSPVLEKSSSSVSSDKIKKTKCKKAKRKLFNFYQNYLSN
ncbi:phoenix [Thalassophryne amazonica]|uniref:phoenix n=1 Tax=Thalassophryne amazonica TaxID=390379 RepID=UPI001471CD9D|nr:phoenix [Thalassophryne amazonica]